jgi:lipopolysaccharide/colanic/teichoic acid biosynthesis glycosyltransferase
MPFPLIDIVFVYVGFMTVNSKMIKRLFDIMITVPVLILCLPVFIGLSIWVKMDSPGPIFFLQNRVGQFGKIFKIVKFRSMVVNAESLGPRITIGSDSRITKSGQLLRKYKLDELPQLVNVLFGDMSLVGPRPEVEEYVKLYPEQIKNKVLSVKPGITDYATLKYRDESAILEGSETPETYYVENILPDKLELYLKYVNRHNLLTDVKLILHTLKKLFCKLIHNYDDFGV